MATGLLTRIFTWWQDNTIGTTWITSRHGRQVGTDQFGNRYYQDKGSAPDAKGGAGMTAKRGRRWVLFNGEPEASRVPPAWHAWLHYTSDEVPSAQAPAIKFEQPHQPNPTGSPAAYHPPGSVLAGGHRAKGTGDYEPWRPS